MSCVVHNFINGRIEPEIRDRIGELRFRAIHWTDGIEVGNRIRWNPAKDVESIATFEVLSSYVPRGLNSVYKVELGRVTLPVHIAGAMWLAPSVGHLVRLTEAPDAPRTAASAPCGASARAAKRGPACPGRLSSR